MSLATLAFNNTAINKFFTEYLTEMCQEIAVY